MLIYGIVSNNIFRSQNNFTRFIIKRTNTIFIFPGKILKSVLIIETDIKVNKKTIGTETYLSFLSKIEKIKIEKINNINGILFPEIKIEIKKKIKATEKKINLISSL